MCHQNQLVRQGSRTNKEIIWANRRSLALQLCANGAICLGGSLIKGHKRQLPQELVLVCACLCRLLSFCCSITQFCKDDGRNPDVTERNCAVCHGYLAHAH